MFIYFRYFSALFSFLSNTSRWFILNWFWNKPFWGSCLYTSDRIKAPRLWWDWAETMSVWWSSWHTPPDLWLMLAVLNDATQDAVSWERFQQPLFFTVRYKTNATTVPCYARHWSHCVALCDSIRLQLLHLSCLFPCWMSLLHSEWLSNIDFTGRLLAIWDLFLAGQATRFGWFSLHWCTKKVEKRSHSFTFRSV